MIKNIILCFILLWTTLAQSFPLGVKGQEQLIPLYPVNIQVPLLQATSTPGGNVLFETGNKNLLVNPGFEHQTYNTGWTTSGTATFSEETSTVLFGEKSIEINSTAQTFGLTQDSTLYQAQLNGSQPGVVGAWVNNTHPSAQICSRQAGADATCEALLTDGTWHLYSIDLDFGATSNGIVIQSTASGTGITFVDEAFVGLSQPSPTGTSIAIPETQSIRYYNFSAFGSTNNKIPSFVSSAGADGTGLFSASNSGVTGVSITASKKILVTANLSFNAGASTSIGISINSNQLTTDIGNIDADDRVAIATIGTAGFSLSTATSVVLNTGEVLRPHTSGSAPSSNGRCSFQVTAIALE